MLQLVWVINCLLLVDRILQIVKFLTVIQENLQKSIQKLKVLTSKSTMMHLALETTLWYLKQLLQNHPFTYMMLIKKSG